MLFVVVFAKKQKEKKSPALCVFDCRMRVSKTCALQPAQGQCQHADVVISKNVFASASVFQGNQRTTMEDRVLITTCGPGPNRFGLVLLLDGHGGSHCVDYVYKHFVKTLEEQTLKMEGDVAEILHNTFATLDHGVSDNDTGTTVSCLLIDLNTEQPWLAHVGDSSVYGLKTHVDAAKWTHQKLTVDHKVTEPREMQRLRAHPAFRGVTPDGYVISPSGDALNMTRAIGDHSFEGLISSKPDVVRLEQHWDVIILASDGVWDVMSVDEVAASVATAPRWQGSAQAVNSARNATYEQHDNTSIVLVYLRQPPSVTASQTLDVDTHGLVH